MIEELPGTRKKGKEERTGGLYKNNEKGRRGGKREGVGADI